MTEVLEAEESAKSATVFVLARNRLLRETLARVLDKKVDIAVSGAAPFSPLATEQIIEVAPDVLLADSYTMNAANQDFICEIQQRVPGMKIVMFGMDEDEQVFLWAVGIGALAYILTDASAADVVDAVRSVTGGKAVCPPQFQLSLFHYVARQRNQLPSYQVKASLDLTSREQQLVRLIGRGLTNKGIAAELNLAEQTVRNHVHRMLRKVGADHRLAIVEMCRVQGLSV
jgi:two-component system, NarL family, response regulator DevR